MIRKKKNECPKCGKVYILLGSLKTHLLSHVSDNIYTCSECLMTFSTETQLEEHSVSHLKDGGSEVEILNADIIPDLDSEAEMCNLSKIDNTGSDLKELVGIYQKLLKCPRCPVTFLAETELENHLSSHSYDNDTYGEVSFAFISERTAKSNSVETCSKIIHSSCQDPLTCSSEIELDRGRTAHMNNDRCEVKLHSELEKEALNFRTIEYNSINNHENPTENCKASKTAVQANSCPKTFLSKTKLGTPLTCDMGGHCANNITLEVEDGTKNCNASQKNNAVSNPNITAEKCKTSVKDAMISGPKNFPDIFSRIEFEKYIATQIGIDGEIPSEFEVESDNFGVMAKNTAASNLPYLMENKQNLGNDDASSHLETDQSEDYCTLFKCIMCPMIFLVKKEIDNHLYSHMDEISINTKIPSESEEHIENCKFPGKESSPSSTTNASTSLVIKMMGSIFKIHLKKVYQRFYKCLRCPMVFLTKTEVKNHMLIGLHDRSINEDILLEKDASLGVHENISETIETLGRDTEAHNLEADLTTAYCPVFQCLKCQMTFLTKTEFESHSSAHIDNSRIKIEISSKLDSKFSDLVFKRNKENENYNLTSNHNVVSYSCSVCQKKFVDRKKYTDHRKIHGVKRFECEECGKKFRANSYLKKHMQVHSRPYKCLDCGKSFKTDYVLELHQTLHSNARPYECTNCGNTFKHKISLTLHNYDHLIDGPFNCEICKNYFENSQLLKMHMKMHLKETTEGKKSFVCTKCNKTYSDKKKYQYHIRCHSRKVPHRCNFCGKSFMDKHLLTQHLRIHTGERPFQCSICQKRFTIKSSLNNHMDTHASNKRYLCHICGVGLNQRSTYYSHLKKHTGVKHHECNICEKKFFYKGSYSRHMSMHFGKKPYQCETCGKSFKQSAHLKSHLVIHTGKKLYQCGVCNKSFTQKSSLTTHHLTHNEGQYMCPECGRRFTQKSTLLNHLKIKSHGKSYWCKICQRLFPRRACLIHHKKNHLPEASVVTFDGHEEIIETFINCSNEHEEIIITQAKTNPYEHVEEIIGTQAFTFDKTQALAFDVEETQVINFDAEVTQAINFDVEETQALAFDIEETQAIDFVADESHVLAFHAEETQPTNIDAGETQALNFNANEEIIITPVDMVEGDNEAIQVHFIF